jgi:hypothetical protein
LVTRLTLLADLARSLHNIQGAARLCRSKDLSALFTLNREFDRLALAHGEELPKFESVDSESRIMRRLKKALRPRKPAPPPRRESINEALPCVFAGSSRPADLFPAKTRTSSHHFLCWSDDLFTRTLYRRM